MSSIIYAIFNIANDKCYVGQTYNKLKRFGEHLKTLKAGTHCNRLLQRAYCKYGEACFIFVTLETCSIDQLTIKEQYWIDILKPEYNLAPVAGSMLNYKHTEEARANMAAAHIGKPHHSEEEKAKRSVRMKGNKFAAGSKRTKEHIEAMQATIRGKSKSAEHKAKIAAGNRGKFVSDETKRKMSEAAKRRWAINPLDVI